MLLHCLAQLSSWTVPQWGVKSNLNPVKCFQEQAWGQGRRAWGSCSIWPVQGAMAIHRSQSLGERPSAPANTWILEMPSGRFKWPWVIVHANRQLSEGMGLMKEWKEGWMDFLNPQIITEGYSTLERYQWIRQKRSPHSRGWHYRRSLSNLLQKSKHLERWRRAFKRYQRTK